jgi:hypothetical protein
MNFMYSGLDLIGKKFERLIVMSVSRNSKNQLVCTCLCECGSVITALKGDLKNRIKSCGCLRRERMSKMGKE